jgi:hypothetical protein
MRRFLVLMLTAATTLIACHDDRPIAPAEGPLAAVSDGASAGGNPDFFFLPPLVGNPTTSPEFEPGGFNGRLLPYMSVHLATASEDCAGVVVVGPSLVPVVPGEEMYQIDWDTDEADMEESSTLRICVWSSIAAFEVGPDLRTPLGFVDIEPAAGGVRSVRTGQVFPFTGGRVLPVKFRIEYGALSYDPENPDALGTEFTVEDEGGSTILANEAGDTALVAVSIPAGAVAPEDTVTVIIAQEEPAYVDPETNAPQCLPGRLLQSNWCYLIRTEPNLYQFEDSVRVEICVDVSPLPERLWDAVRVHKYNESEGLVRLPWAEPTLIGRDCSGLPEFGASGTSDGGFWGWLGRWAGRLLTPTELRATTFAGVPKGIGGMGGSFSDFGGAVPEITEPLVFTSDRDGDWDIYAMSIDSSEVHQLTDDPSADTGPAISPDGQTIAFVSDRAGSLDIWTMSTTGADLKRITTSEHPDSAPAWSPDGTRIAFHRLIAGEGHKIWLINADGSAETEFLIGHKPAWSPDGTRLAFAKFGGSEPDYADVFVANLDGSGLANLTDHDANDTDPTWSPDGSQIAFMSTRDGNHDVFVMNADGSDPTNLTATSAYIDYRPDWSPDGTTIAFVSRRTGNADVWTMTPTGQVLRNMTNHPANDVEVALRTASATPPVVVVVDGVLSPGEWLDADHYTTDITLPDNSTTTADIYVTNDPTRLLVAGRFDENISAWGSNTGVRIDEDGNGAWDGGGHASPYGEDGWVAQDRVYPESDRFLDEFFDTAANQDHTDEAYGGVNDGAMASVSNTDATFVELAHPLASGDADRDAQLVPYDVIGFALRLNLPRASVTKSNYCPADGFASYTIR